MNILKKIIILAVFAAFSVCAQASQSEAEDALNRAQNALNYMAATGFKIERATDLIEDARIYLVSKDYAKSVESSQKVDALKELAVSVRNKINTTGSFLSAAGKFEVDSKEQKEKLSLAKIDFENENYESAQLIVDSIINEISPKLEAELEKMQRDAQNLKSASISQGLEIPAIESLFIELENSRLKNFAGIEAISEKIKLIGESIEDFVFSRSYLEQMSDAGFPTSRVSDLIGEGKVMLAIGNFERAQLFFKEIESAKESAFSQNEKKEEARVLIESLIAEGYDMAESKAAFEEADSAFEKEDFEGSLKLYESSISEAQKAKESAVIFGIINREKIAFNLLNFVKVHWLYILLFLAASAAISYPLANLAKKHVLHQRKKSLEREHPAITSMMKKAQEDYYKNKILSKSAYGTVMDRHQERLLRINEAIPLINLKIAKSEENLSGILKVFK